MKCVSLFFAIFALISGLIAAWYWYRSSIVHIEPSWSMEPVIDDLKHSGWITAIMKSASDAAYLNKRAAQWTALSVVLGGASSVVGAIDC